LFAPLEKLHHRAMIPAQDLIVGREQELQALDAFLATRDALPAALMLEGEAGIGKTTLWEEGIARGERSGFRVLACRPAGAEVRLSFAALGDLLENALDDALPALPPPQRRALEVALLLREREDKPPDQRAIAAGLLTALRALARDRPLLVGIDDAQWLDQPSAMAIEYAARRLRTETVALLVSRRVETAAVLPLSLDKAYGSRRLTRVPVGALSLGALHHLLRERTGRSFNRPTLRRIHETSAGNPFFALELARSIGDRQLGTGGAPLRLSDSLNELLGQRLSALSGATREALSIAATASLPSVTIIEAIIGTSARAVLNPAVTSGLIRLVDDRIEWTHPLLAAASYTDAGESERRRWHARLAAIAPDLEERARHLAVDGPNQDVADLLLEAARQARARGAPAAAAELFERAIDRLPSGDDEMRARWTVEAAPTVLQAGERQHARSLLEAAIATIGPGALRSDALLLLSDLVEDDPGGDQRTIELIEQAMREAGADPARHAAALLIREMWERHKDRLGVALGYAKQARAFAERSGDERLLAHALTRTADLEVLLGLASDPVAHFRRALEVDSRAHVEAHIGPSAMLAVCLIRFGRLADARPLLLEQRRRTEEEGDEASRARLCLFLSELEWLSGRWDQARGYASEGMEVAEQASARVLYGALCALLALVECSIGELDEARTHALEGLAICEEVGDDSYAIYNRQALGFLELSLGNVEQAHAYLAGYSVERGIEGTKRISFIGDEIEALVYLGDLDAAESLVDELGRRGELLHRPTLSAVSGRGRGLVLGARGDAEGAVEPISHSIETFTALGLPFEVARSHLALGEVHRRAKRKRAAREAFETALRGFEELGAPIWAAKARGGLARIGGRVSSDALTPTERRVAELVAAGHSNKEVAAELFVTLRAVEANLSRIYGKLGIRSRTELARQI
jgi:DNA-binding CsgD family transcriptional regulator